MSIKRRLIFNLRILREFRFAQFVHLCPGLNVVTNFANFTIFRFTYKFNKFCDFSLNSTRYTKIRCLNDFSVLCAEIYNFMLITSKSYKSYKIYDFSLTSRFFNEPLRNLRFFLHFFVTQIPPTIVPTCGFDKICDFSQLTIQHRKTTKDDRHVSVISETIKRD